MRCVTHAWDGAPVTSYCTVCGSMRPGRYVRSGGAIIWKFDRSAGDVLRALNTAYILAAVICAAGVWLSGCTPSTPTTPKTCAPMPDIETGYTQLLVDAEAELGPLPGDCVDQLHATEVVGEMHDMPEVCWRDEGTVVGCNSIDQWGYPHIWIVECQREPLKTIRMERLHTLLACMNGDDDHDHSGDIWDKLGVR